MNGLIFDNTTLKAEELEEKFKSIIPRNLPDHERQLILALSDCVYVLFDFNVTKDQMVGTPLHFANGVAYSLYDVFNIPQPCSFTDFIQYGCMEYQGSEKNHFLTFNDIRHFKNSYLNGQTHLVTFYTHTHNDSAKTSICEHHVLLYKDSLSGDILGLGYEIRRELNPETDGRSESTQRLNETDVLTGCCNRATLRRLVPGYLKTQDAKAAFIILDIDNFKKANDIGGHDFGDKILVETASMIRSCFRTGDIVARLGGDEFAIFVKGVNDREIIRKKVQLLLQKAEHSFISENNYTFHATISVGIAVFPDYGDTLEELYHNADEALYRAKALGKNAYSFYREITEGQALNETFKKGFRDSDCREVLDAMTMTAVYVIEAASHRVLFYNKRVKEVIPNIAIGAVCHEVCCEGEGKCKNCPLTELGEGAWARIYNCNNAFGDCCEMTATRMLWQGNTQAILIRAWPEHKIETANKTSLISQNLIEWSHYDSITGGRTRYGFIRAMENMRARGLNLTKFAILFINIKGFKAINEVFGSDAGDGLLRAVLNRFETSVLSPIVSARKESDHFVFLVEQGDLDYDALHALLEFRWRFNTQEVTIHCRCGIFNIDDNNLSIASMIDRAKLAKEHITDEFVQPHCVFQSYMRINYVDQMLALSTFEEALERNEFEVYYQPVVDAKTQQVTSAEALVRWNSSEHGFLPPNQFVPILEQYGYITKLDKFVFESVAKFQQYRLKQGLHCVPVSVNLSKMDFYDQQLLQKITDTMQNNLPQKGLLNIEITESVRSESVTDAKLRFFEELHAQGAKVYLDDFGIGYSTFDMLKNYDLDVIKIDMSFVRQIAEVPKIAAIVNTIIYMSHSLGMKTIAEGVETAEELKLLQAFGCDYIQGYYFAKPMPQDEFAAYLEKH